MSFITPFGALCYTTMSFRLKSAGAMYQRGIQQCLHTQLEHNAKAYVDDVVVKTREGEGLISHLAKTFDNLRMFKMKLNPKKCTFGVPSWKLFGYMVVTPTFYKNNFFVHIGVHIKMHIKL
jgi:hypothetical protein